MSIIFKPSGTLDLATDPVSLPESVERNMITSGAMQRCKNLRLDQNGVARTRDGSTRYNSVGINPISKILEQSGYRYAFGDGSIYRNEQVIGSGYAVTTWSAIKYNAYNSANLSIYALNGIDRKRIEDTTIYGWGIEAPTVAPTLETGASTGLTGAYNAKYSYCRKEGSTVVVESNCSPEGTAVTLADGSLSISWTASSDSQVTHVRLYRTVANGSTYYHDQDLAIGTTTLDSDTSDAGLGSEEETDHDLPPLGSFLSGPNFNGYCFMIHDNRLYFSKPKQPDYWPEAYYIEVSPKQSPGQTIVWWNGQPYFLTKSEIYQIQGTGADSFFPFAMKAVTGAQGPNAACSIAGHGIFHIGTDGLYLYSGSDTKVTQARFEPIFRGESVNDVPGAKELTTSWLIGYQNKLYMGYTSAGASFPKNVIVYNLDTQRTTYYSYPFQIRCVALDETNSRLLAGGSDGYVYRLEVPDYPSDAGSTISWDIESKVFTLPTRRHFPRWVKWDVDASAATSVSGQLMLDGTVHQNHALTGSRDIRKRLVKTGNGRRASFRITGTGAVSIYGLEGE
jgi:hypothetical protein